MMHHQASPISSPSSTISSQREASQSTVVGPSDHYGVHHQPVTSNNCSNGFHDNKTSAKKINHQLNGNNNAVNGHDETKVCVIVDSKTPVIFKIPVSPSRITLAHLKQALPAIDQPDYKYFFKSNDSEFGIVKEEIQEDYCQLPTYRNRVVAWIVTPGRLGDELVSKRRGSESGTCNLTCTNTTTSYDDGASSLMTTDLESTSYFTETDDDTNSRSNYSGTTYDTFISQRRSRYAKNSGKSPTHQYHDHRHHHHHHQRNNSSYRDTSLQDNSRDMNDLSDSSSQTSSCASYSDATAVHCITVHLVLTDKNFLGLHIYGNSSNGVDEGIYVEGVTENSAVALDGRIESGDKLIQVNDINLEELSNDEAVTVLKDAVIKRGPLKLVVAKYVDSNKHDNVDALVNPKEAIHPIDTAAWVAHAQALTIINNQEQANSATSSPSFGSNAQDTDCIRPASAGMATRLGSGLRLNRMSSDIKEIIYHMKLPEIGLDIRDREWLKIHIPKAFLGSDLVTWLERNVYGFNNNRDAKKFAIRMLKEGYIRDPISMKSFSSKSYYTFMI